jgi:hypothetical protein
MKIRRILLFEFLFIAVYLNAQTDFRPGCVILANGDSLFGEIDYRGDILMGQVCRFRNAITDTTVENEKQYFPGDIMGYRFDNGKFFQSRELEGKKLFLEFLIKGKLCIYYHRDENGNHYYLEKDSSGIVEIPYETGIKYNENIPYTYNSNKHIGVLNAYMHDAPDLKSSITNIGEPGHKNLIRLAENYNNEMCKDEPCIIYEKNNPALNIF